MLRNVFTGISAAYDLYDAWWGERWSSQEVPFADAASLTVIASRMYLRVQHLACRLKSTGNEAAEQLVLAEALSVLCELSSVSIRPMAINDALLSDRLSMEEATSSSTQPSLPDLVYSNNIAHEGSLHVRGVTTGSVELQFIDIDGDTQRPYIVGMLLQSLKHLGRHLSVQVACSILTSILCRYPNCQPLAHENSAEVGWHDNPING